MRIVSDQGKRLIATLQSYTSFLCLLVRFAFHKCNFDVYSAHDVRSFGKSLNGFTIPPKEVFHRASCRALIVMNCIWVLRKAKGHNFGKLLLQDMIKSEKDAAGFATIGLEDHWSPWFKKWQMKRLGFKPLDSIKVAHKQSIKDELSAYTLCGCQQPNTPNRQNGTSKNS